MVAGVDGYKRGWVAVIDDGERRRVEVFRTFAELAATEFAVIVIDIPIGLMTNATREADRAARKYLGSRWPCVFRAPFRSMLTATSYLDACLIGERIDGKRCSQQAYAILKKISEVDAAMSPTMQGRIREGHPEVSFAVMAGGRPIQDKKKSAAGLAARLNLLDAHFPEARAEVLGNRPSGVGRDDLADAYAMLWTARRVADGTSIAISGTVQTDDRGLRAEVHA